MLLGVAGAVRSLGGEALPLPADVADFDAVDKTAGRAEAAPRWLLAAGSW